MQEGDNAHFWKIDPVKINYLIIHAWKWRKNMMEL